MWFISLRLQYVKTSRQTKIFVGLCYQGNIVLKCDCVIALTHMRWPNDTLLAQNVSGIDLILGGHDHDYNIKEIDDKWIIKSGTDFRELSYIQLGEINNTIQVSQIEKILIESNIEQDSEIESIVASYLNLNSKEMEKVLGIMNSDLEGRFSEIRTSETNLGNFLCDILLANVNADCAVINSGSLRSDQIHEKGEFKLKDLKKILPYIEENVVISVTGEKLLQLLENSVSGYPKNEGRFLQVSGIQFAFDPSKPSGFRVNPNLVKVQDEYLKPNKEYSVVTERYVQHGKEGYDFLKDCPILIDGEEIPLLLTLVINHFDAIAKLKENNYKFRSNIVPLMTVNLLMECISREITLMKDKPSRINNLRGMSATKFKQEFHKERRIFFKESAEFQKRIKEYENHIMKLAPKIENRIICIKNKEHMEKLLYQRNEERMAR